MYSDIRYIADSCIPINYMAYIPTGMHAYLLLVISLVNLIEAELAVSVEIVYHFILPTHISTCYDVLLIDLNRHGAT